MTTPRVKIQCANCTIRFVHSAAWVNAENATSIKIADAHVHKPHHLTDLCNKILVVDQEGMFDDVIKLGDEVIEEWAKAIQTVALEAPFDTDVYLDLCSDMHMSSPIDYEELMEAYEGEHESFADFARYYYNYARENIPSLLYDNIDWENVSRKLERMGFFYYMEPGHPRKVHVFDGKYLKRYYN